MKKLIKNTSETFCARHCCQDTPKRAVRAEGGAVSINTGKNLGIQKSPTREITDKYGLYFYSFSRFHLPIAIALGGASTQTTRKGDGLLISRRALAPRSVH